ncbi:multidrug efflux RND transporter periplasmic adaptor subunit VexC [Corallincola platygyrae]
MLTGCNSEPEQTAAPVIRPVLTEVVQAGSMGDLNFTGVVQAANRAELSFRVSGHLTELLLKEGDLVKAGQLLASLESSDAEIALKAAQIELNNSRIEYERAKVLFEQSQAISRSDMDQLTTRFQLAENRVNEATQQLAYTRLVAPFDGIVGQRMVDKHIQLQANEPVMMVHDLNELEIAIQVPDHLMNANSESGNVFAELSVIPNKQFALSVKSYSTQADPATQTYTVTLSFDDLDGHTVLPGMTARVMANAGDAEDTHNSHVYIPLTAVSPNNLGQQYVWIIRDDNRIEQRFVETGELHGDRIAVIQNLVPGERIAIAGVSSLSSEMDVRPTLVNTQQEQ